MPHVGDVDIARMRDQLFFEGPETGRRLSRFWLLLVLAAVIAGAGVVGDSTATVIGAMIVAPLMVPILGTVLAVVLADRRNLLRSVGLVVAGAIAVIAIAWLLGHLVGYDLSADTNSQIAARVSPRLIDLLAAVATGAVGSVALVRSDISDTLPGVAIAISLVPPLSVVGLTWESGHADQARGALLLFVTNVSAILATGVVVMAIYHVYAHVARPGGETRYFHRSGAVVAIVTLVLIVAVPLALASESVTQTARTEAKVRNVVTAWAKPAEWSVVEVTTRPSGTLVRVTGPLPEPNTKVLRADLDAAGLSGTSLQLELVPGRVVEITPHG